MGLPANTQRSPMGETGTEYIAIDERRAWLVPRSNLSPSRAQRMNDTKIVPVGRPAPAFTAPDDRGQQVSLADYKGRYVVLFFYPKDDTAG